MKDPYLLSVITPVHNMDKALIEKAYQSLKNQTLGFEKIEWLVVVHNSPEEDVETLREIVGDAVNVQIHHLNDGIQSPASPRNYALDRVQGTYIGFLDADDTYLLETCEIAMKHVLENEAQMVLFRLETEAATEQIMPIRNWTLLNQAHEVVVVDTESWDSSKFICNSGNTITAKMYERRFIDKYQIRFDEEVPFASDTLYNLACFSKVKKLCFLPQLIGYHYYMNGGSLIQNFYMESDEVMRYAKGIYKILDFGLKTGLYLNNLMWELISYQATIMLVSTNLTYEERKQASDMLVPYFKIMTKMKTNKIYSEKDAKGTMDIAKLVLCHPLLIYNVSKILNFFKIDMNEIIKSNMEENM